MPFAPQPIAEAFPPGTMLAEKLDEVGMPVKEFALRCGKPEPTLHEVLRGRSALTPEMALLFEKTLGIPARLWLAMQCQYDEARARKKLEQEFHAHLGWVQNFPYPEMVKQGYLSGPVKVPEIEKLKRLLEFFGFARITSWQKYYQTQVLGAQFRLSLSGVADAYALSAWLRHGELQAQRQSPLPPYSATALKSLLPTLCRMAHSGRTDCLPELAGRLEQCGVRLVITPHLSQSQVRGASRWQKDNPLIQVDSHNRRGDCFWGTLFHELAHILLHGKREVFLEGVEYPQKDEQKEAAADHFANTLLLPRRLQNKLQKLHPSQETLERFCQENNLHPAFALSHLRHLHLLKDVGDDKYLFTIKFD